MQLHSGETICLVKTKYGFSLSIRCGNSFMSADLTADELDLFSGHIVAELMNGTETKVTVDGTDFSLAEDDLDIVQPEQEAAAYLETRTAIDADAVAAETGL